MTQPADYRPTIEEVLRTAPFEYSVGRLAMNVGALEDSLLKGIKELLPFQPKDVLAQKVDTSLGPMLDRYSAFVRRLVKDQAILKEHASIRRHLIELKNERNRIVHGPWIDVPGTNIDAQKLKVDRVILLSDLLKPNQTGVFVVPNQVIDLFNAVYKARRVFDAHRLKVLDYAKAAQVTPWTSQLWSLRGYCGARA